MYEMDPRCHQIWWCTPLHPLTKPLSLQPLLLQPGKITLITNSTNITPIKKKKDPTLKRKCIFFRNFENKKSYYGNNLFPCLGRRRLFCFNSYYDLLYLTWILHGMRIYLNFTFHFKGIPSDEFHIKFMWSLHSKVILY